MTAPGLFALRKKPRLFHGSAHHPLSRTWDELAGNKELRKGVEFGLKAAGEVSKDAFEEAGKDAAIALAKYYFADTKKGPELRDGLGAAGGLLWKGVRLYDKAPEWGRSLGERINKIKGQVYGAE